MNTKLLLQLAAAQPQGACVALSPAAYAMVLLATMQLLSGASLLYGSPVDLPVSPSRYVP
jgi:hypothetical protein